MKTISLYVKGSAKGLKKLESLHENGELSKLIGHEVLDIRKCSKEQIESLCQKGLISPVNTPKTTTHWIKYFWDKIISAILSGSDFVITSRLSAVTGSLFVLVIASILVINQMGPSSVDDNSTKPVPKQAATSTTSALISKDVDSFQEAQECYAAFQESDIQIASEPIKTKRFFVFVVEYQATQYDELVQTLKQCEITPFHSILEQSKVKLQFFIKEPYYE